MGPVGSRGVAGQLDPEGHNVRRQLVGRLLVIRAPLEPAQRVLASLGIGVEQAAQRLGHPLRRPVGRVQLAPGNFVESFEHGTISPARRDQGSQCGQGASLSDAARPASR